MIRVILFVLIFLTSHISSSFSAVVNILNNGSFEEAGAGSGRQLALNPPAYWTYLNLGNTGEGWHGVNGIGDAGSDQTPFGNRLIELGNGSPNPGNGIYQTFSAISGVTYSASIFAKKFSVAWDEPVAITFDIRDKFGAVVDSSWSRSSDSLSRANGIWTEVSFTFTPQSSDTFQFRIFDSTPLNSSPNSDLFVDNAVLTVIPEPSSLSLLALGGVMVALGRRKRA